jgi:hypothetical protein
VCLVITTKEEQKLQTLWLLYTRYTESDIKTVLKYATNLVSIMRMEKLLHIERHGKVFFFFFPWLHSPA